MGSLLLKVSNWLNERLCFEINDISIVYNSFFFQISNYREEIVNFMNENLVNVRLMDDNVFRQQQEEENDDVLQG